MRLFFIGWSGKDFGLTEVVRKLKQRHEIVYWSGDGKEFESLAHEFSGTIFHGHFDALHGIPARGVNVSLFPPPGVSLLTQLLGVESTVLTMMNKHFENKLVSERKHFYYHLVRYWNGVLTTLRPDAIIFPCAPHTVYDFVIYGLAKLLSIRTISFELTLIGARSLVMQDFSIGSVALRLAIAANARRRFELCDLPADIRQDYERQLDVSLSHTPPYMTEQFRRYAGLKKFFVKFNSVRANLMVHKDFTVLLKLLTHLPRRFMQNMKTEYASVESEPDFTENFIYAPLSYQPERTSSPQGGIFVDQLLMLEILSASVPPDWFIYVKEHPVQWLHRSSDFFSYRHRGYYREIAQLKNVRVVPLETDTYTLVERSAAVATITSTAGWEAILRSKPVIVFGYPGYQHAPGIIPVTDAPSCKQAVEKIISGFMPTGQQTINYLASFAAASFHGYCEPNVNGVGDIGASRNAENIVHALETELHR